MEPSAWQKLFEFLTARPIWWAVAILSASALKFAPLSWGLRPDFGSYQQIFAGVTTVVLVVATPAFLASVLEVSWKAWKERREASSAFR